MEDWRSKQGPWNNESNREVFEAHGLPCIARRNTKLGAWCGYVGIPPTHPYYKKHYDDIDVDVHGGLTYGELCDGDPDNGVCHHAKAGEPDEIYWLGFDCAHAGDLLPYQAPETQLFNTLSMLDKRLALGGGDHYWTLQEVKAECEELAKQLKEKSN